MSLNPSLKRLQKSYATFGSELFRPASNELHFLVSNDDDLLALAKKLRDDGFYLLSIAANDEQELEDYCFKLYYIFSHAAHNLFLIIENALPSGAETFASIRSLFASAAPFEREIADLMGLRPHNQPVESGHYLHADVYPPNLYPLRRNRRTATLKQSIQKHRLLSADAPNLKEPQPAAGEWLLSVGPVHAAVIEPGRFLFRLGGEMIEEVEIHLGYTHKGIERLFQVNRTLQNGWELAEHVSGDSSFAHSMAYCQAVENLAGAQIPPQATLLRGLFLELERLANHIGDCGALAQDVAMRIAASEMAALREKVLRLNLHAAGHRLLRGVNRPGGVRLPKALDIEGIAKTIAETTTAFTALGRQVQQKPGFRDRAINTGILTRQQAANLGATGLVARASGLERDFRLRHPFGIYRDAAFRQIIRKQSLPLEAAAGDVFARFLIRWYEAQTSAIIIRETLSRLKRLARRPASFITSIEFRRIPNYEFGLGYVEGWRGDIVYWVMKDKFQGIYCCKVRDPSTLNWAALKAALAPHSLDNEYIERHKASRRAVETIIADFPLVNKSFNLSYSGNDL